MSRPANTKYAPSTTHSASLIEARRSIALLGEPGISDAQVNEAVRLALLAPDHRRLTPWRFILAPKSAYADMAKASSEGDQQLERKWLSKFERSPHILISVLSPVDSPKVPIEEQWLSLGAAIEHMLLYLAEQGLGTMWRSGEICQSVGLKSFLGLKDEQQIGGMIYVGAPQVEAKPKPELSVSDFLKKL